LVSDDVLFSLSQQLFFGGSFSLDFGGTALLPPLPLHAACFSVLGAAILLVLLSTSLTAGKVSLVEEEAGITSVVT
jgi:hypothetical protein